MGKTVTDILTIVSGASWTLFYLLVIFLSYRDKDLRHAVLGIGIQFQLGADLFVCVEHSFFRPAIATYHQQNMAGFRSVHFHRLLSVWQARAAIPSFPLPFLSLLNIGVDLSYFFVYLISVELDHSQGMYAAFIQNLMMSWLSLYCFWGWLVL
jgi:hypothetical protein